jgi:alcohol dehydrogenase class IV
LSEELAGLAVQRPLIVTDPGLAASGVLDQVQDALNGSAATVYDQTPANPTEAAVRDALALYRSEGCDGLIGVGGGSSIDLAKGVRLLATHDGPLAQYAMSEGGVGRIRPDIAKLIAIPTTAGTGSEVGRGAVVIMDDGRKLGVVSPHLIPNVAICDPDLTLTLPPGLTAGTGMDAIAHCVETYLSNAINPPAEGIALDGLRRASRHIIRATQDGHGQDRDARWNMMMAAMEGAMAFQKGLGAVHAMSHPLGALPGLNLHHGTLNAVVMPAVLRFNRDHVGDKYSVVAATMGLAAGQDLPDAITALNGALGLPANLREMGVTEAQLPLLAEQANADHTNPTNPRPAGVADYLALFQEAMG